MPKPYLRSLSPVDHTSTSTSGTRRTLLSLRVAVWDEVVLHPFLGLHSLQKVQKPLTVLGMAVDLNVTVALYLPELCVWARSSKYLGLLEGHLLIISQVDD